MKISLGLPDELRRRLPELAIQESRHDAVSRALYSAEPVLDSAHESGINGDIDAAALELGHRELAHQANLTRINAYAARSGYLSAVQMRRTGAVAEVALARR